MSLVIRTNWLPPAGIAIDERIAEVGRVVRSYVTEPFGGTTWFGTGGSRRTALARPVPLEALARRATPWRRVPLIDEEAYWAVDIWNGRDEPDSVSLSIALFDPPTDPTTSPPQGLDSDRLVISGLWMNELRERGASWEALLEVARVLALELGGRCIVASSELWEMASANSLNSSNAVYAAFWGPDRHGHNPAYARIPTSSKSGPYAAVACESWSEVDNPDPTKLQAIAELLH